MLAHCLFCGQYRHWPLNLVHPQSPRWAWQGHWLICVFHNTVNVTHTAWGHGHRVIKGGAKQNSQMVRTPTFQKVYKIWLNYARKAPTTKIKTVSWMYRSKAPTTKTKMWYYMGAWTFSTVVSRRSRKMKNLVLANECHIWMKNLVAANECHTWSSSCWLDENMLYKRYIEDILYTWVQNFKLKHRIKAKLKIFGHQGDVCFEFWLINI